MEKSLSLKLALSLLAVSLIAGDFQWRELQQLELADEQVRTLLSGTDISPEELTRAPLEVRLARAVYLAAKDRHEEALDAYGYLVEQGDTRLRVTALFDLGNLHLRRALTHVEKNEINRALPLVELAKDAYKKALRLDPSHWDSKYNLEVAMRLLPEMDRIRRDGEVDKEEEEEGALWTTVPGFPRGLP
ncbi:MxaK protein [Methylocaldum sp.]|uniref:MxaK protein n=1 Tax=Methylocaldum sp. TaxID=1969727 RepID=UPI002D5AA86B|nr:MxaK protein [Methylocaldum sp.]HYE37759.1 MxaK protein [Methylocaldum sp.]